MNQAIESVLAMDLFGIAVPRSLSHDAAWSTACLIRIRSLPIRVQLDLLQHLISSMRAANDIHKVHAAVHLLCTLLCDFSAKQLQRSDHIVDRFIAWIASDILGSDGLFAVLIRLSSEEPHAIAVREMVMATVSRTLSLSIQLVGYARASTVLNTGLELLQSTLSKRIEVESTLALRTASNNLRLICQTLLNPSHHPADTLSSKLLTLAAPNQNIQDAVKALLELHLDDPAPIDREGNAASSKYMSFLFLC